MIWTVVFSIFALVGANSEKFSQNDADDYLEKYGYMELLPAASKTGLEGEQLEQKRQETRSKAVSLFQEYAGLPVTGELDEETKERMMRPRCGQPDFVHRAGGMMYKWDKSTLQWAVVRPSSRLDLGQVRGLMGKALNVWSNIVPLDFMEVSPEAEPEMQIGFGRGSHGDAWPFDGPGNVLAHATYPQDGRLHFDEDENWVVDNPTRLESEPYSVDLLTVAVHEAGHALGLPHLRQPDAIMYAIYQAPLDENGQVRPVKLTQFDIQAMQQIYGPRGQKPPPPPPTEIPVVTVKPPQRPPNTDPPVDEPEPTPPKGPSTCPQFTAAVTAADGATYFFNGNAVWKKSDVESDSTDSSLHYADRIFLGVPNSGLTAAVTSTLSQLTLLFQGRKIFAFSWSSAHEKFLPQEGYPKTLTPEVSFDPQGAFQWKDGNLILYRGDQFVVWDDYWNKVTFTGKVSDYFPKLPSDAKTCFAVGENLYFLNGENYSIYDMHSMNTVATKPIKTLISC